MRKLCSTMLVAGLAIFLGCSGGSGGGGYTNNPNDPGGGTNDTCPAGTVCMRAASFLPTSLTVNANTTVTFANNSVVDHNVVFDQPPAATTDLGLVAYGSSVTRAFGTVGTYNFHCTIHSGMTGRVVVQ